MGQIQIALDTSAIISLGCVRKFHLITKVFYLNSPMRVKTELEEIAKQDDEIGRAAKYVLGGNFIKFHELTPDMQDAKGEIETANLANKLKPDAVITDDVKSMKKIEDKTDIPVWFSSFIIYSLCELKIISYQEGWSMIDNMKAKRGWKENLIIESAKLLWNKAENENSEETNQED